MGGLAVAKLRTMTDVVTTLSELMRVCRSAQRVYWQAAQAINLIELRRLLETFAKQRRRFAAQLEIEVVRLGGVLDTERGSRAEHSGKARMKSAVSGDGAIIASCARIEDESVRAYEEALLTDLEPPLHTVVERQRDAIVAAADRIGDLQSRYRTVA
jgi:uncharacterized protein (TIGR02284 family)